MESAKVPSKRWIDKENEEKCGTYTHTAIRKNEMPFSEIWTGDDDVKQTSSYMEARSKEKKWAWT
jgi:hypothetical protein